MKRDEHWMACYVLLSRALALDQILIFRLCRREHLEGGPPRIVSTEKERLRAIEHRTLQCLDRELAARGLHQAQVDITAPLLR